jgi:hypothetical protein
MILIDLICMNFQVNIQDMVLGEEIINRICQINNKINNL